jgi:hypothetical protein
MKNALVIFIFCLLFVSCKQECNDDPNLTSSELSWLSYNGGEVLIFRSNSGLYDTVYIQNKNIDLNSCQTNSSSKCQHQTQEASISGNFKIQPFYFEIHVGHINSDCSGCGYYPYLTRYIPDNGLYFSNFSPVNNIVINNITYNNVYILTVDTAHWIPQPISEQDATDIWKIYYTKQNGILEFDYWHGLSWVRIN